MSDSLQPLGLLTTRFICPWDFPGKNIGVGCHFFFQGIFPIQGSNLHLLHCQAYSLPLSHLGSMIIFYFILNFKIFFVMKKLHQTSLNHSLAKGNKYLTSICQMTIHFISFPPHSFLHHIIFELLLFVSLDPKSQFCDLKSQSQFLLAFMFLSLTPQPHSSVSLLCLNSITFS